MTNNNWIHTNFGGLSPRGELEDLWSVFAYSPSRSCNKNSARTESKLRGQFTKGGLPFLRENLEVASAREMAFSQIAISQRENNPNQIWGFAKEGALFLPKHDPKLQSKIWYDYKENWQNYPKIKDSLILLLRNSHKVLRENYDQRYWGGGIDFCDGHYEETYSPLSGEPIGGAISLLELF